MEKYTALNSWDRQKINVSAVVSPKRDALQEGLTNSMKYSMKNSMSELSVFPVWSYVSEMAGVSAAPKSPESSCGLNWKYQRVHLGQQLQMHPDMFPAANGHGVYPHVYPQLQLHYATTTTTAAVHHTASSSCGWGDHCNHCNHSNKHKSNHLSVNQRIRSAIRDSQQPTSLIGFLFWNFRHRLVRYYWCRSCFKSFID